MQKRTCVSLSLVVAASTFGLWNAAQNYLNNGGAASAVLAQEPQEEEELPLVLSAEDDKEAPEEEPAPADQEEQPAEDETLPAPAVVEGSDIDDLPPLELPSVVEEGDVGVDIDDLPPLELPSDDELTQEEMEEISTRPLFKEFTNALGDVAPTPEDVDLGAFGVPGAELIVPDQRIVVSEVLPETSLEEATQALDEVLDIADCDLNSLELSPNDTATLAQIDAEIKRLCPFWINAELNRSVIGRRELNWKQQGAPLYTTTDPKPIDAVGSDWAMAPDAPYFFQVTDSLTHEIYYTKAGDFEQIDPLNFLSPALVRDDRTFMLSVEPGRVVPTGRAERIRVRKNGAVQGTDAAGKLVTDVNVANVPLFIFENPARLHSEDGVFFTPTPFSGEPRQVKLPSGTKTGVTSGKVLPSNGAPEEIFARIVVLCKTKKRFFEILSQPRLQQEAL
ncbi:MAG: hypothetical protein IKX88_07125 [Thermoguttaceae bacterium]|nr:hypothetical protein [Thermoguttaceae bacterium]